MMIQAYKLKGKIDAAGNLVLTQPTQMPPGEVEIIVLQAVETLAISTVTESKSQSEKPRRRSKIKALQDWFEKTQPAPPDFDPDEARWEALQEKYNL